MPIYPKPPSCEGCPDGGKSFVRWVGPEGAPLLLIGQGPGEEEAYDGHAFVGPSGKKLTRWLAKAGINRETVRIGNVVQCWLPGNRAPTRAEATFCEEAHWAHERLTPRVIVAVGVPAMKAIISPAAKASWAGRILRPDPEGPYLMGILHPAYILRGNWGQEPAQMLHLERAGRIARGEEWPIVDADQVPPNCEVFPTLDQLWEFYDGIWSPETGDPSLVACDIECAGNHLRCIGFARVRDNHGVVVHLRTQGGDVYWSDDQLPAVVDWLWAVLADPAIPLCFHNGQAFDTVILEENGFVVEGYKRDTMIESHIAFPEMPKSLAHLSNMYLGVDPDWKGMVKEEDEEENK